MTMKDARIPTLHLDSGEATPTSAGTAERLPVLLLALGRGRTGRTTLLNSVAQFWRPRGANLRIWSTTTSDNDILSALHSDTETPEYWGLQDVQDWLEGRMENQIRHRYDALLDVGGYDCRIRRLGQEVKLVRALERTGIRPVAVHMVGPDKADLDCLDLFAQTQVFLPEATLIVFNDGLVAPGRSARTAFEQVVTNPVIQHAIRNGAKVVRMPALQCMSQIIERQCGFRAVADGTTADGTKPLSLIDQKRTAIWWDEEMPLFFSRIPPLWMPA